MTTFYFIGLASNGFRPIDRLLFPTSRLAYAHAVKTLGHNAVHGPIPTHAICAEEIDEAKTSPLS